MSEKPQLNDANASLASIVERPQDEHGTEMVTQDAKRGAGRDRIAQPPSLAGAEANAQDPTEERSSPTNDNTEFQSKLQVVQTGVQARPQKTAQQASAANRRKDDDMESSDDELASDGDSSDDYDPKDKLLHILCHWMRESVDYNKLVIEPYELTEKDLVGPFKDTLERGWPFVEKEHDEDVGDNLLKYNCSFDSLKRNKQKSLRVLTRQVYVSEQDKNIEVEVHGLQIFLFNEHTQLFEKQYDTVIDMFNKELQQE